MKPIPILINLEIDVIKIQIRLEGENYQLDVPFDVENPFEIYLEWIKTLPGFETDSRKQKALLLFIITLLTSTEEMSKSQ